MKQAISWMPLSYKPKQGSCGTKNLTKKVLAPNSPGAEMSGAELSSAETAASNRRRRIGGAETYPTLYFCLSFFPMYCKTLNSRLSFLHVQQYFDIFQSLPPCTSTLLFLRFTLPHVLKNFNSPERPHNTPNAKILWATLQHSKRHYIKRSIYEPETHQSLWIVNEPAASIK